MCGIVGSISKDKKNLRGDRVSLNEMISRLTHRGPDSSGSWAEGDVLLGHTRLATVDLTAEGDQPMTSRDDRWVIVYNGEIYNVRELIQRIGLKDLKGRSDTEVLLETIARCGVFSALQHLDGMFSFAAYDRREKKLWLARDRFGEKPLFLAEAGSGYVFASELKAISSYPGFNQELDPDSIVEYLSHRMVPSPHTIYKKCKKLLPGELICIDQNLDLKSIKYWDAIGVAKAAKQNVLLSESELLSRFEETMEQSVGSRMVADVPVGVFLSGGIDSSLVAGVMQKLSGRKSIKSFSIEFESKDHDESLFSQSIAKLLGTDHTPFVFKEEDAARIVPEFCKIFDEPLASESALPLIKLSELARSEVTVSLSGEGADEFFCGYPRYVAFGNQVKYAQSRSRLGKTVFLGGHSVLASPLFNLVHRDSISRRYPTARYYLGEQSSYRAESYRSIPQAYRTMRSAVAHVNPFHVLSKDFRKLSSRILEHPSLETFSGLEQAMLLDTTVYLPDVLLARLDRASMASSLECRAPLLNPQVYQFAWSLAQHQRVHRGKMKWPLRQMLTKYVPEELIERPKRGLSWPIDEWLRGCLRDWASDLLNPGLVKRQGIFDEKVVERMWRSHLQHKGNYGQKLWTILVLQSWLQTWDWSR